MQKILRNCFEVIGADKEIYKLVDGMKQYSEETFEHSLEVSELAGKLGAILGYGHKDILKLNVAGILHDVGKLAIPKEILHKKGPLTEKEWMVMKRHSEIGYRMILPYIDDLDILLAVRQHHERMDGTGYPDHISSGISEFARIIMLADVFDGLTRKRIYRSNEISIPMAREIMTSEKERYDKQYLKAFLSGVV